jgi:hypothetical protein
LGDDSYSCRSAWVLSPKSIVLSDKDRLHPRLRDLPNYFDYRG